MPFWYLYLFPEPVFQQIQTKPRKPNQLPYSRSRGHQSRGRGESHFKSTSPLSHITITNLPFGKKE